MGAMCGHGALAAALECPVVSVMPHLEPGWVNVPRMKAAIEACGRKWQRVKKLDPGQRGVILIQWTGPWTEPGVPPAAACKYRHWVASRAGLIYDVNWPEAWMSQEAWKRKVPDLIPDRATGYQVWGALRISGVLRDE